MFPGITTSNTRFSSSVKNKLSKEKPIDCAIAAIVGLGCLALVSIEVVRYLQPKSVSNLNQIRAIIIILTGIEIVLWIGEIINPVKNQQTGSSMEHHPSLPHPNVELSSPIGQTPTDERQTPIDIKVSVKGGIDQGIRVFYVRMDDTVGALKNALRISCDKPTQQLILLFEGQPLWKDENSLTDYNIQRNKRLQAMFVEI